MPAVSRQANSLELRQTVQDAKESLETVLDSATCSSTKRPVTSIVVVAWVFAGVNASEVELVSPWRRSA